MRRSVAAVSLVLSAGFVLAPAAPARAASFVVDTLSDNPADGDTLREAVDQANGAVGPDEITFAPGLTGTIALKTQLDVHDDLRIVGPGSGQLVLDVGNSSRLVQSFVPGTDLTLSGMSLRNGTTAGPGGAIVFVDGGTLELDDVVIEASTGSAGGGIMADMVSGSVLLTDVDVTGSTATTGKGGGILIDDVTGDVRLERVTLSGNTATIDDGGGGVIGNVAGEIVLTDVEVVDNVADQSMGGLFAATDGVVPGPITVTRATVSQNESVNGSVPGLTLESDGGVHVADSTFDHNISSSSGGGLAVAGNSATVTLDGVRAEQNSGSIGAGVLIFNPGGTIVIDDLRAIDNVGTSDGGGLNALADELTITGSTITGNSATNGGGIRVAATDLVAVRRSTISGNTASSDGGGLHITTNNKFADVTNSTVSGNSAATDGGGIYVANTLLGINLSTITENSSSAGGASFGTSAATIDVERSIIAGNGPGAGPDAHPAMSADLTIVQDPGPVAIGGNNLVGVDPLLGPLTDNGGTTLTHLPAFGSPAIDAGGMILVADPHDQRGFPRLVGDIDLGAVERQLADNRVWIPVTPARLVDTRENFDTIDGLFAGGGRRAGGSTLQVPVAGRGGVPPDARAVIVNITSVESVANGHVTAHPCLPAKPNASSVNYTTGVNLGSEVIVQLDAGGDLCLYTHTATDLTLDVAGYVPVESPYVAGAPARYADTRDGFATFDGLALGGGPPGAGQTLIVKIGGRGTVPVGADAAVVNLTAIGAPLPGFATIWDCVGPRPNASSINYVTGVNRANEVVARLGAAGEICIYTHRAIDLAVDVVGHLPPGTDYSPQPEPDRLLDTRAGFPTVDGQFDGIGKRGKGTTLELPIAGRAGIPGDATTVTFNVTAVEGAAHGFSVAYACTPSRPNASSLNFRAGINGGNDLVVGLSPTGTVCIYVHQAAHLTVDVSGYTTN